MSTIIRKPEIEYPDSDGQPIADNTLQFQWIVTIRGNLDVQYASQAGVFVAGDLLWYTVEGQPKIRQAPDIFVAFGRPKGYRGSYMQWREGGVAPKVVFEILSPNVRANELVRKFRFYERYGVEEYYVYDPDKVGMFGWLRDGAVLREVPEMEDFSSPALGIRFSTSSGDLVITGANGERFLTFEELAQARDRQALRVAEEARRADEEARGADEEARRAEAAEQRARKAEEELDRLRARLREQGEANGG